MAKIKIVFLVVCFGILFGCATESIYQMDSIAQDRRMQINSLNEKLINHKVNVIQNKKSVVLILPNKNLFNYNSANFTKEAYEILDSVLNLTKYYEISVVSVVGLRAKNSKHPEYLFMERAHKVAQYLWRSGVDANFVYAADDTIPQDKSVFASCIVISFRKL
jgi:outer membrane protein OmpA-like peptidoglycan-associated protein